MTRLSPDKARAVKRTLRAFDYRPEAQLGCIIKKKAEPSGHGPVMVISAGTSDIAVAEEAAMCAELFGNRVTRLYDVGVAGLHRLRAGLDASAEAAVLIVVAGMEGALPSVVAGLLDKPVIAVPTSVGYGTAFGGSRGAARDAQRLRQRRHGGQHRQRIRRGAGRDPDQSRRLGENLALMVERRKLTSGRARRAIRMGGLASQIGSSYLWTTLRKQFLSDDAGRRELLDVHIRNARRVVEGSRNCAARS